eukprot:scaffold2236_cov385-Prasinococcus_capsulatus_cf.AAC.10
MELPLSSERGRPCRTGPRAGPPGRRGARVAGARGLAMPPPTRCWSCSLPRCAPAFVRHGGGGVLGQCRSRGRRGRRMRRPPTATSAAHEPPGMWLLPPPPARATECDGERSERAT